MQLTKEVTVRQVFEALKENGFHHIRQEWMEYEADLVIGGCILGQAAINLGVQPHSIVLTGPEVPSLFDQLNRFTCNNNLWPNITDRRAGSLIVNLNDWVKTDEEGEPVVEDGNLIFEIETYEELVNAAEIILSPYFNETITVNAVDYKTRKTVSV